MEANKHINNRNTRILESVINLKMMHLVSKDPVAFNHSEILGTNRFDYYTEHFKDVLAQILENQEKYLWLKVKDRDFEILEEKDLDLVFLDTLGDKYTMKY